jgi:putative aminopeptidase FrvX
MLDAIRMKWAYGTEQHGHRPAAHRAAGRLVEHNIPAHTFLLHNRRGETVRAVSTSKPPHFMTAAERSAPLSMESILLDAGVCSRKDATELLGFEPGLVAVPDVQFSYNDATGLMLGKAFDCRLGCAGVVEVLRALKNASFVPTLQRRFPRRRKTSSACKNHGGRLRPALALCLEGTPPTITSRPGRGPRRLEKSVQIRFAMAARWRIPALWHLHAGLRKRTTSPTSARSAQAASPTAEHPPCAGGVPTLVMGIPVRYAHTHYGYSAAAMSTPHCARLPILRALTPDVLRLLNPRPDAYIKQSAVQ